MHATKITLYRQVENRMEPVDLPFQGDSTQIFWLDLWTDGDAPVRRIKIEPQLSVNVHDLDLGWITYPMEVRVVDAKVPDVPSQSNGDMRLFLCGPYKIDHPGVSAADRLHSRNQQQDVALATRAAKADLLRLFDNCEPAHSDPERYLHIRDYLFRMR